MNKSLFITCPKGIESLLEAEVKALGGTTCKQTVGGLTCDAKLDVIYQICLWSRLANRVLLNLFSGAIENSKQCYQLCFEYPWTSLFKSNSTLSVNFNGQSDFIRNEMYGAQLIKDAIVDQIRLANKPRPNIDPNHANCVIQARLRQGQLKVFYDLSGHSLHQRGYRQQAGQAPLKENLAAALLYRSAWEKYAKAKQPLIDPCCGSGTLLIEAAMIATEKAPGLTCEDFGFMYWQDHHPMLWNKLKQSALEKHQQALQQPLPMIIGYDKDAKVISYANNNIKAAGFKDLIQIKQRSLKDFSLPKQAQDKQGLIISNPPYGERLTNSPDLIPLYQELGLVLSQHCMGWHGAIFTADKMLAKATGLRSTKQYAFFNGTIPCKLYLFALDVENKSSLTSMPERSQMIFNRLRKNSKHLKGWRKQNNIEAYRIYDADIPEYACAIDVYNNWAHVQEYMAPKEIPQEKTQQRLLDVIQALPLALDIPRQHIVLKQRKKQQGKQQYERQGQTKHKLIVHEGNANFIVNCKDYLDTGLFLDHRPIRKHIYETAKNKTLLNLFCYTCTVSVQAALGGATKTVNVDMSRTYLDWAQENFKENKLKPQHHEFIQANCLQWIQTCRQKFDLIFLDPPSFSNSKRMEGILDIQRDHEKLVESAMELLKQNGELYFSTNFRKFKLSESLFVKFDVTDITAKTIDKDFARNGKIHQCFCITPK